MIARFARATLLVALGVAVATSIAAAAEEPAATINGCFDQRRGDLRVLILGEEACGRGELPISWSVAGQPGPPGPPGSGVASLQQLEGIACTRGDGSSGVTDLTTALSGLVTFACVAVPALESISAPESVSVGGVVRATVSFTSPVFAPTTVSLRSSDPTVASVGSEVVIPAGEQAVETPVRGVSPGTVQIVAEHAGTIVSIDLVVVG